MPNDDRILMIGEAPSSSGDPSKPLTGRPMRRMLETAGIPCPSETNAVRLFALRVYAATFARVNLVREYPGRLWPRERARAQAEVISRRMRHGRRLLLLGRKVAAAFDHEAAWFEWRDGACVMPHPSGRNRWWNDLGNRAAARRFLAGLFLEAIRQTRFVMNPGRSEGRTWVTTIVRRLEENAGDGSVAPAEDGQRLRAV